MASEVGHGPHAGGMSRSKRKSASKAGRVQQGRRDQEPESQSDRPQQLARTSVPELLQRIKDVRIDREKAEDELASLIDAAVRQGIGWPLIATQLGVTRQAARQQYLRQHPGRQDHVA